MLHRNTKREEMKNDISRIARQLFRKRKPSYVPVYLERFASLDKLIADDRIAIDFKQKLVVLDTSMHLLYMDDDRKYAAFFDTIRAYINFSRGRIGIEEVVKHTDRINFMVMLKQYKEFNEETGDFYDPPQETAKTILVGYYQHGKVDYAVYEEDKIEKEKD